MKLTICAYDAPGNIDGISTWLKSLVPFLKAGDHEVTLVFYVNTYKKKELALYHYFKQRDYKCKLIHWGFFADEVGLDILKELYASPPDVFISNYYPFSLILSKWCNKWNIPTVMVLHNDDEHHLNLFSSFGNNISVDENVTATVVVSKTLSTKLKNISVAAPVYWIPYGVSIPGNGKSKQLDKGDLKLLYVGRLNNEQKRIADVTSAFCRASKEVQGVSCTICGVGTPEVVAEIQDIINSFKQEDKVCYIGSRPNHEIYELMQDHHCIVLLSEYEGFGIVVLEGMSNGLVPICFDMKSGVSEELINGYNSFIVKDRDIDFVETVKKLKLNPESYAVISYNAFNTVNESYSVSRSNEHWLKLFKKLKNDSEKLALCKLPQRSELIKMVHRHTTLFKGYNPRPQHFLWASLKKIYYHIKFSLFS